MPSSAWNIPPSRFDFEAEYLRLGGDLCSHRSDEAALRSAVSRAYYAAFHCAREKLGSVSRSSTSPHLDVWKAIGDRGGVNARAVKSMGLACRDNRVEADYEPVVRVDWKATAERVIDQVRRIQQWIAGMP
jgi:uncharacterized protein (UPF0332 family)